MGCIRTRGDVHKHCSAAVRLEHPRGGDLSDEGKRNKHLSKWNVLEKCEEMCEKKTGMFWRTPGPASGHACKRSGCSCFPGDNGMWEVGAGRGAEKRRGGEERKRKERRAWEERQSIIHALKE